MPDAFADLEAAREAVLAEAGRFVDEIPPILRESLRSGVDRVTLEQAAAAGRMSADTRAAFDAAVERAIGAGVDAAVERLRRPEIWLAPHTAPALAGRREAGWPVWLPEWMARLLGRRGSDASASLGALDDPGNRIWIAISSAATPLDPILQEFGFVRGRPRFGGGRFGVQARSLPRLDPSGTLGRLWTRYRAAYERLAALSAEDD